MTTLMDAIIQSGSATAGYAAYGLIAHGFRYPDEPWHAVLTDPNQWQAWPEDLLDSHREAQQSLKALKDSVDSLSVNGLAQLQEQFAFLFGHSVRGKCPPYELEFGKSEVIQRASDLADISGFYSAFGMSISGEVSERPDHLSVQAEFMATLYAKIAWGLEHGDSELLGTVQDAQRQFLKSHMGRWLPAFARRVKESSSPGFYYALADFAESWVTCDCNLFGISMGSPYLQLRPTDPVQESTQSCGLPGECGTGSSEQLTQLNVSDSRGK